MSDVQSTQAVFSNGFGTVFKNHVEFNAKKQFWAGGSHESIPLRHVTSIRVEYSRSIIGAIVLGLVAFIFIISGVIIPMALGLLGVGFAIVLFVGHPTVRINTSGNDARWVAGKPGAAVEAQEFVAAVKEKLYADD